MSLNAGRSVLGVLASSALLLLLSAGQANAQCAGGQHEDRERPQLATRQSSGTPYQYAALRQYARQQQYQYAAQQYAVQQQNAVLAAALLQQQQNAVLAAALQQQQQRNALLAAALLQQQNAGGAQLFAR